MNVASTFLSQLATRIGVAAVERSTDTAGWHVAGVAPLGVVAPETADGVAEVLALCAAEGVPVEPAGAGTWLARGRRPANPPLVVSTRRLDRVLEYEPADLVAGVQAGVSHEALHDLLAAQRQALPLDAAALPGATLGATTALGAAGPLRAAHRTPRDLVLGVELATGDGRLLRFGGRVVKNVAGFDITRLSVGSAGTLGIITAVHFLLRALPAEDRTWLLDARDAEEAASLALAVRDAVAPESVEALSPALARDTMGESGWRVAVRLRGTPPAVAEAAGRLPRDAAGAAARQLPAAAAVALRARLATDEAAAVVSLRLSHYPASLAATIAAAEAVAARAGGGVGGGNGGNGGGAAASPPRAWRVAAHGADGIVRLWLPAGAELPGAEAFREALATPGAAFASRGGTVTCAVLPPALQDAGRNFDAVDPGAAALMQRLRGVFDPAGILSPGRQFAAR
jgi:glycolate oxidase FAD binding subunit